jgi:putative DNA primase/helicase
MTKSIESRVFVSAEAIARALGGRKVGNGWIVRCTAHDDSTPSLSVRNAGDNLLLHCHAGCRPNDVIAGLKKQGLWYDGARQRARPRPKHNVALPQLDAQRSAIALKIWQSSQPAKGTLVETYQRSRGIHLPAPDALRFHPGLKHPSGSNWPAAVALVTHGVDGKPIGIHRTFLERNGNGKAPVDPTKMMLGPFRGGVVRLGEPTDTLMVGEGIETCLAAMQASGHPAWAALSTSGLRALELPEGVRDVIVLADGDEPGEAAARDCGSRWKRQGRRVRIARPPIGMDFNDVLLGRAARIEEGVP